MSNKYIVRQSVKDSDGVILGYEILYCGENQAFASEDSEVSRNYAAADTIYSFLTQNSNKGLKGTLNFMTFTTMLLMKKTPHLFDKSELVIQIDDSVIIHPLSMHFVKMYAKEGYKIAVNEFQFVPRYLALLDSIDYIKVNAAMPAFLKKHSGCVITVSSMWGQVGASCEAAYSATKGAVIALTKALAKELGPSGIRVNCVAPGVVLTDMCANVDPETMADLASQSALGRNGTPQEIAKAILHLAELPFVTGQVLGVNGGLVI